MTYDTARRWIGLYFLIFCGFLGGYILIFSESFLLPISNSDAADAFKIVIPVLVGQITIVFQWLSTVGKSDRRQCPVPAWAIKTPPILSVLLVLICVIILIYGNLDGSTSIGVSPEGFKSILTFAVSILNASTVFLVARIFPGAGNTA